MKKILILTTGGTIVSMASENGLQPKLSGHELLNYIGSMTKKYDIFISYRREGGFDTAMKSMAKGKKPLKTIRALIYAAIKPRYPKITLMEVGELLTEALQSEEKMEYISETLKKALTLFMPEPEEEIVQGEQKPQPITKPITK